MVWAGSLIGSYHSWVFEIVDLQLICMMADLRVDRCGSFDAEVFEIEPLLVLRNFSVPARCLICVVVACVLLVLVYGRCICLWQFQCHWCILVFDLWGYA